jgi:hypothetical protein
MRLVLGGLALLVAAMPAGAQSTTVPYYPWCAVSPAAHARDSRNCGYTSYAQCMAAVRGQTGICFENTWQAKPAEAAQPKKRSSRNR